MVEKRTIVFLALGILVWASVATGLVSYYYLEQTRYRNQSLETQGKLNSLAENYDIAVRRRNLLSGDYGTLLAEYQYFIGENYSSLMGRCAMLLSSLYNNYSFVLDEFPELNATFHELLSEFQTFSLQDQVTKDQFGSLLRSFHDLSSALAVKDSESSLTTATVIKVSLNIDYGNSTVEWHNVSTSTGETLFDLTRKVANITYSFWPTMEPGHMLVDSINARKLGYWMWSYWNADKKKWIPGPVGCDAWMLNDNGVYKWECIPAA